MDLYSLHERTIVCLNAGKYLSAQALQIYRSMVVSFSTNLVINIFNLTYSLVIQTQCELKTKHDGVGDYNGVYMLLIAQILLQKWRSQWLIAFCFELTVISWADVKLFLKNLMCLADFPVMFIKYQKMSKTPQN